MRAFRLILVLVCGVLFANAASMVPFNPQIRTVVASGGAAATYIVAETWEGTPTGWSKQNNASLVDLVNATTPIRESQSLFTQGDTGSTLPPYAYRTAPFGEVDDCYAFFLWKPTAGPTADDFNRECMWLADYPANQHLVELDLYRFSSTDYRPRVFAGTTGQSTTAAGFALGSTNAIWLRHQKGTGANERVDVWWTDASAGPPYVKPADGSNWHAHRDDGNYTTSVEQIQLGAIFRGGHGTDCRYDWVLVSSSPIGTVTSMPTSYTTVQESNASAIASTRHVGFDSTDYYAGQVWDPGANITLGKVSFTITPTGTIEGNTYKCEIWSMSGGNLLSQLAASNPVKGNSGWSAHVIYFDFPNGVSLTSGTSYAVVVTKNAAPDSSNYIDLHLTAAGGLGGTSAFFTSAGVSSGTSTSDHKAVFYK